MMHRTPQQSAWPLPLACRVVYSFIQEREREREREREKREGQTIIGPFELGSFFLIFLHSAKIARYFLTRLTRMITYFKY